MKTLKLLLQALLEWIILVAVILIVSWVIIQIKILIMKPKSNSTHICTKCQRPLEEGGGCYTFCNGKNFLPIPEENPKHPGCRRGKLGR